MDPLDGTELLEEAVTERSGTGDKVALEGALLVTAEREEPVSDATADEDEEAALTSEVAMTGAWVELLLFDISELALDELMRSPRDMGDRG